MEAVYLRNLHTLVVKKFYEVEFRKGQYQILTHWLGFRRAESTWEDVVGMFRDLPEKVEQFLRTLPKKRYNEIHTVLKAEMEHRFN